MSKRLRHQPGFYATLFNDVCDRACNSKYRPIVVGVYEVERIVTKRVKGGREKYLIQWQNYSSNENTWEQPEKLAGRSHHRLREQVCRFASCR